MGKILAAQVESSIPSASPAACFCVSRTPACVCGDGDTGPSSEMGQSECVCVSVHVMLEKFLPERQSVVFVLMPLPLP